MTTAADYREHAEASLEDARRAVLAAGGGREGDDLAAAAYLVARAQVYATLSISASSAEVFAAGQRARILRRP